MNPDKAKIVGMMLVRNEDWIVRASIMAALQWLDTLVILDNGSTDDTVREIIAATKGIEANRIQYISKPNTDQHKWREMDLRQELYNAAQQHDATHYAVIDADEIPTCPVVPHLRRIVAEAQPGFGVRVPMHSPYGSLTARRTDGNFEPQCGIFLGFAATPGSYWASEHDGYQHHHRAPYGIQEMMPTYGPDEGGIMHLQFASIERLKAKAAYYKATETIMYPGRMTPDQLNEKYDWTLRGEEEIQTMKPSWWAQHSTNGIVNTIDLTKEAWQAQALRDLVKEHGSGIFAGINMHGVV